MAVYLTLYKKNETEPTAFQTIDEEICALLGKEVDPKRYVLGWYNSIGYCWVMGQTNKQVRETLEKNRELLREEAKAAGEEKDLDEFYDSLQKCLTYLDENYRQEAWRQS